MTPKFIPSHKSQVCCGVETMWENVISSEIRIYHEEILENRRDKSENFGKKVRSFLKIFFKVSLYRFAKQNLLDIME